MKCDSQYEATHIGWRGGAGQVKALAVRADNLKSTVRAHMGEEKNQVFQAVLSSLHMHHAMITPHKYTHIQTHLKSIISGENFEWSYINSVHEAFSK